MSTLAVIPARYDSKRFPGKPLADRTGKPLIQHVVEQVKNARHIDRIIVATDDQRIHDAARAFDCEAMMTSKDHSNGTSRIGEVIARLQENQPPPSIIVNVQGDEPLIEPHVIDELIEGLQADPDAPMATLASEFAPDEDPADPNIVKLVTATVDGHLRALYFSRSLIPYDRDGATTPTASPEPQTLNPEPYLKHPGLYAYRRAFLLKYVTLSPTPLEQAERLEQLRALEHGYPIAVIKTTVHHHGIDTPEQYEQFVQHYQQLTTDA